MQGAIESMGRIWDFLQEVIPVISPLITVLLTGILVYLYKRQSEILDEQRRLSESDQRALPRILTYRLFSWRTMYQYKKEGNVVPDLPGYPDRYAAFIAYLSNPGKGFAENLWVELRIKTPSFDFSFPKPISYNTNMDQMLFGELEGGVIAPEENEISMYTAAIWLTKEDLPEELLDSDVSHGERIAPTELLWLLEDLNETPVEIGLFIHYSDGTGICEPIQLLTSKAELESYNDLTETWRSGEMPSGNLEPIFSLEDVKNPH